MDLISNARYFVNDGFWRELAFLGVAIPEAPLLSPRSRVTGAVGRHVQPIRLLRHRYGMFV